MLMAMQQILKGKVRASLSMCATILVRGGAGLSLHCPKSGNSHNSSIVHGYEVKLIFLSDLDKCSSCKLKTGYGLRISLDNMTFGDVVACRQCNTRQFDKDFNV